MGFKMRRRKMAAEGLALLFALLLVKDWIPSPLQAGAAASDEIQNQIDQLEESAAELEEQRDQLADQLKDLRADKAEAMERKQNLEQQMALLREDIANSDQLLAQYASYLQVKEEELRQAEEKEAQQYRIFCQRVRAMEEAGSISYWSVLFSARDFSEFLDNMTIVSEIMEYDNAVMDLLMATRQEIAQAKAELKEKQAAEQETRDKLAAQRQLLQEQAAQVDQLVAELSEDEAQVEAAEAALLAEADEIDRQIAAKERELESKLQDGSVNIQPDGDYAWPLPSSYNVLWSLFGGRTDPITGKPASHTGIDVAAPKNTPIYAAKGGVVLTSTYYGSYGNYVSVSHGDGTSTLYAHMNSRAVKEGDVVTQGQVLGYVGATGRTTGNHLHFEVRVNGQRQDPVDFYAGWTLYYRNNGKTVLLEH